MQCDQSLERYGTVLSCGVVCFVIHCGSNFCSVTILWKAFVFVLCYSMSTLTYSVV